MLLDGRRPSDAVSEILGGVRDHELWRSWASHLETDLTRVSDDEIRDRLGDSGVVLLGDPGYPAVLQDDPEAPAVLFYLGDLGDLGDLGKLGDLGSTTTRRVAVVGTRHCSERGRSIAGRIGHDLAHAGIDVVSGLALGIDAAAHRGVMGARQNGANGRAIAIVASGLDVVYPKSNGGLWKLVAESGLVISESPPGTAPDRFRFPLRNRLVAAVSDLVVVVESRIRGGSMITVDEALKRDVSVMAVPGPVDLAVSAGTNQLLRDGAMVMATPEDVLAALGLTTSRRTVVDRRPSVDGTDRVVLAAFDSGVPLNLDMVEARVREFGVNLTSCALSLGRLEVLGWIVSDGGWFEKLPSPPAH
jgi:DNA processing protein